MSNLKFPTEKCPICNLELKKMWGGTCVECETKINTGREEITHYQVTVDKGRPVQFVILPPYVLRTWGDSQRTELYKFSDKGLGGWTLVYEIPAMDIRRDPNLVQRLAKLVIFS
jgi:hypothetical protein